MTAVPPAPAPAAEPAEPDIDDVAVRRVTDGAGDHTILTPAERIEAVRVLHARGLTDRQVSEHTGMAERTALRCRRAAGLPANVPPRAVPLRTTSRHSAVALPAKTQRAAAVTVADVVLRQVANPADQRRMVRVEFLAMLGLAEEACRRPGR